MLYRAEVDALRAKLRAVEAVLDAYTNPERDDIESVDSFDHGVDVTKQAVRLALSV